MFNRSKPKNRQWSKHLKDEARRNDPAPACTPRQYARHITPQDNDLAAALDLNWEELSLLSDGGTVRRICPAHYSDSLTPTLSVMIASGVLLLRCDRNCSVSDITAALRASRGVKPVQSMSDKHTGQGGKAMSDSNFEKLIGLFTDQPPAMRYSELAKAIGLSDSDLYLLVNGGQIRRHCPVHGGVGETLEIGMGEQGQLLFHCYSHGCSHDEIIDALLASNDSGAEA